MDVPKEFERALDKGGEHVGRSYRVASYVGFAVAAGLVVLSAASFLSGENETGLIDLGAAAVVAAFAALFRFLSSLMLAEGPANERGDGGSASTGT
ncbi:hypothetical protein [Terrabacter sp. MAHUQ-38]|uniref:hypothetical protein n=1 Tax=unclassified Terrabacter TaxID=2630222 RepID=UPI00165E7A0D|nr:hypothetical protein [Terrabacter sp. MAHUQ-38]MBC9819700.1 hypothetical protein [Terrabacter sp. MAHUQ-38]